MTSLALRPFPAQTLRNKALAFKSNGLLRNLSTMGAAQIIIRISRLAATILLSRLLLPQDYGLAAIVLTVYEFVSLFTRNGITAKVVQAGPDDVEAIAETAHRLTWILCFGLMAVQCLAAVPIAWAYHDMRLAMPIATMSLIYLATPLSSMQSAFQQREGRLGRFAFAQALQVVIDNALTAILALSGFGLWAIILPKILVAPIWVIVIRFGHAWRPSKIRSSFAMQGWRDIAKFSRNVLGVELLTTFQANVDNLLVGYFLGVHALGIYYFAFNAGLGITQGLISAAGVAIYPHLCAVRSEPVELKKRYAQTMRTMSLTILQLVLLQSSLAPIYVPLVFGEKWVSAIPVLSMICLSALARPFASACSQLLKAIGKPEIELRWQVLNTIVLVIALVIAVQISITAVAAAIFLVQTLFLSTYAWIIPRRVFANAKAPDQFEFDVISTDAALAGLSPEWEDLWIKTNGAYAAQSFTYGRTAWNIARSIGGNELFVLTARKNGNLVMVWPMIKKSAWGLSVLSPLNSGGTEYDSCLTSQTENLEDLTSAARSYLRTQHKISVLNIAFAPCSESSKSLAAPYLRFEPATDWKFYWASLKSGLRTGMARRRRRLEEAGTVISQFVTDPEERILAIDWALNQKRDWMKRKHLRNDFIDKPGFSQFLKTYATECHDDASLAVMTMTLDSKIIAVKIGMIDRNRFEGFITVYDPAYETYSPGQLLLIDCLQWCCETSRDYDFRIGDEAYKFTWASGSRHVVKRQLALTTRGTIYLGALHVWLFVVTRSSNVSGRAIKALTNPGLVLKKLRATLSKPTMSAEAKS